ncbi:MAG TPA: hypothetical protein VFH97_02380, partial [Gemmatimonadales bacterium]|nr:hypothetical protein [Gemmatimonadales bacterium]
EAAGGEWRSATGATTWRTETGIVVGTLGYMSPEQATATPQLDGRSDQYALACVIYEMLSGETPFQGASLQLMVSKLLTLPPPSVRVVRDTVPGLMDQALQRALSRTPADRFRTCREFVDALGARPTWWHRVADVASTRLARRAAVAVAVLAGGYFAWRVVAGTGDVVLDPSRIVVFPLAATDPDLNTEGVGWNVALAISSALEHAEPLRVVDGWSRLTDSLRADPRRVRSTTALEISRDRRAGHYLDGAIRSGGDTIAVTLALHDVRGDSIVAQETVSGPRAGSRFEALGLQALTLLLPKWLEPGRRVDLSPFTERRLGAIALSIEGDRRYRQSRFAEALAFYRRAVEEDSLLAFAAVKGAQAGTWTDEDQQAAPLVALALAHDSLLPPRHRLYARGLDHYLAGRADSAVARFREALDLDPDWSEARMALGEVYYHLMPSIAGLDTLAERQFRAAQASDTTFSPPMYHLAQLTLRRGEIAEAERHWRRLDRLGADTVLARQLSVMVRCVRDGPRAVDWAAEALRSSTMLWRVGKDLSPGALQVECAKAAFRAVFLSNAPEGHRYTALLGLQGLLLAQGRFGEAAKLLDSALASGFPSVYAIYVMDSFVDTRFVQRAREAERIARAGAGDLYERARPENRLQLAAWLARFGDRERAARVVGALAAAGGSDRAATLGRVL